MPRRRYREEDDGLFSPMFDVAKLLPWWVDVCIAITTYFIFRYLHSSIDTATATPGGLVTVSMYLIAMYAFPLIFTLGAIASFYDQWRNGARGKELLRNTKNGHVMEVISKMSWQDFERLIGEHFREEGYEVTQQGGLHADGGVDIEIRKNDELYLVQCKHYRSWKVPVQVIRELYGVMTTCGAVGGFVVTAGYFTEPAKEFARGLSITLLDRDDLERILKAHMSKLESSQNAAVLKACSICGGQLVRREGKFGPFLGCSNYPKCSHTEAL